MTRTRVLSRVAWSVVGVFVVSSASSHNPVTTTVRFNREIVRILNTKCVACHSEDGMAMSLQGYDMARPWAEAIKDEVLARRMPPWPAERGYGEFANDSGLTLREQQFLISWIDGGVPEGDGEPAPFVDHSDHWMLGAPDAVREAISVGDSGSDFSSSYIVDLKLGAGTAIRAIDLHIPDRRARAAFVYVEATGMYVGGWTPGHSMTQFPQGSAIPLASGSRLRVDVIGSTTPRAAPPRIGVYFASGATSQVTELVLRGEADASGRVRIVERLAAAETVIGFRVSMDAGGRSLELNARSPNAEFTPLLLVRDFRPEWPTPFLLRTPVALPAGSMLTAVAHFNGTPPLASRNMSIQVLLTRATAASSPAPVHDHSHAN